MGLRGCQRYAWRLAALWACSVALVRADAPWRVTLLQPKDPELITRVEGQTRDLGVRLEVVPDSWRDGSIARAARLAAEHGADFVVRVERTRSGVLEVHVYDARLRSLRARSVPPPKRKDRLGSSAEFEAAAIMLRGELNALIEAQREAEEENELAAADSDATGGASGDSGSSGSRAREVTGSSQERQDPRPQPTAAKPSDDPDLGRDPDTDEDQAPEPEPEPEPEPDVPLANYSIRQQSWTVRGGLRGSIPVDRVAALGAYLGGRVQVDWFELGVVVGTALPFELAAADVRIELQRSSLMAEAAAVIPWGPRLRLLFGVEAGVVMYARSTEAVPADFTKRDPAPAWNATLGVQAELQWLLARQLGLALGVGLGYIPRETRFSYLAAEPNQPLDIAELRTLEPQLSLGIFGLFGR